MRRRWSHKIFWDSTNPVAIYLLKVRNRNTCTRCEICSELKIKTPERRQWCHTVLVFLSLTLSRQMPTGKGERKVKTFYVYFQFYPELWNTKNQRKVFFYVQNVLCQALYTNKMKMIRVMLLGILCFWLLRHVIRSSYLLDSSAENK